MSRKGKTDQEQPEEKQELPLIPTRRSSLAVVGDAALMVEGLRVSEEVRLKHLERRGQTCADTVELLALTRDFEKSVDAMLARKITVHPAYPWFSHVKGCGPENIAKVVARIEAFGKYYPVGEGECSACQEGPCILDNGCHLVPSYLKAGPLERFPEMYYILNKDEKLEERTGIWVAGIERLATPSKLRKLAGHMPGMKRQKGHLLAYDQTLKMLMWRMGGSLMRAQGKFYDFYLEYRNYLEHRELAKGTKIIPTPKARMCPECEKEVVKKAALFCPDCGGPLALKNEPPGVLFQGHLHAMAKARMQQAFLDGLWAAWREALGLPVTVPYPMAFQAERHHEKGIDYKDWMDK